MARGLAVAVVCASLVWLTFCGGIGLVVSTSPGFSGVVIASGTCTAVQLVNIVGPGGGFIQVTTVTLFGSGSSRTLNFCGDVSGRFPLNHSVTVNFTNGSACATPVSIIVA